MKYSVIVLLEETHEDFPEFLKDLREIFSSVGEPYEILIVANGTGGFLKSKLGQIEEISAVVKAYEFYTKTTQAIALMAGVEESKGEIVFICSSYLQLTKNSLLELIHSMDEKTHFISPWRYPRIDPRINQIQSRIFNSFVSKITGTRFHDLSCSVRIFRREVLEKVDIYGNMYRFLPVVAARKGFKGKELKCGHREERAKKGLYGLDRYVRILIDIFTLYFNTRFSKKPFRFFSAIGAGFLAAGFLITLYVFLERIFMGELLGNRVALLVAILLMVIGVEVAGVGLLGEIIAFVHGRQKSEYSIEKRI